MSHNALGSSLIVAGVLAVTLGAQDTPPQQPQKPADPSMAAGTIVTIEGCLQREADVPGRTPNPVEKAGIAEDFILTQVKFVKGSAPASANAAPKPDDQPVGTSGSQPMYEVRGIEDEMLKKHAGQRVQIDGTIDPRDVSDRKPAEPQAGAPSKNDLPEIQATAIRVIAGPCTAAR
jgi:hypothetical protein